MPKLSANISARFPAPLRAGHVAERIVDGELVLYDPANQRVHVLNATAALAWQLCDGKHTQQDLVAVLAERYPESRRAIEEDVSDILKVFHAQSLLEE